MTPEERAQLARMRARRAAPPPATPRSLVEATVARIERHLAGGRLATLARDGERLATREAVDAAWARVEAGAPLEELQRACDAWERAWGMP